MGKLVNLYSEVSSWVGTLFIFLTSFLGDSGDWIIYILIITLIDLIVAIIKSIKLGKGILSNKLVSYLGKISIYVLVFIGFYFLDKTLDFDSQWFSRIYSSIIIFSEIWSILANVSIIRPNLPVIRLLQSILKTEISKKLEIDQDKLDKYFKSSQNEESNKNS
jgi:cytochrome c biogenesis protein CcdA